MDADLQDPPEELPVLLDRACRGGRRRRVRRAYGPVRVPLAAAHGACLPAAALALLPLPRDGGVFVLLSRDAVERVLALRGPAPPSWR